MAQKIRWKKTTRHGRSVEEASCVKGKVYLSRVKGSRWCVSVSGPVNMSIALLDAGMPCKKTRAAAKAHAVKVCRLSNRLWTIPGG